MIRTDYVSHHFFNTMIKNDVRAQRLLTINLNLEKIANLDVKCRSLWYTRMRWNYWSTLMCVGWPHVVLWNTFFKNKSKSFVMEQNDNEYSPWCRFNGIDYPKARAWVFQWYLLKLYFVQDEEKNSHGIKWLSCN
jgi:hypothetical protein